MDREKITQLIERVKNDRKLLLIIVAAAAGIILLVISLATDERSSDDETIPYESVQFNEAEYTAQLEKKLNEMITLVNGAGRTKVIVTLECDYETVYAKDGSLSQDDNSTDEDSEYIIIDSEKIQSGLLLKTVAPKVRGVAVVCEGGDNPYVISSVTEMLSAVLDIGVNRISVAKIQ